MITSIGRIQFRSKSLANTTANEAFGDVWG